jgi:hypothetical protein
MVPAPCHPLFAGMPTFDNLGNKTGQGGYAGNNKRTV